MGNGLLVLGLMPKYCCVVDESMDKIVTVGVVKSRIAISHKVYPINWLKENVLGDQKYPFSKKASKEEDLTGANRVEKEKKNQASTNKTS